MKPGGAIRKANIARVKNFIIKGKGGNELSGKEKSLLNRYIGIKGKTPKVKRLNAPRVRRFLKNAG
ncbi:MAG: hypothetical protein HYW05_04040 [Candidatus Diapherotrites archaeon]|nr:hypothetical protein [Candidatus Diapherotrites archaeon]